MSMLVELVRPYITWLIVAVVVAIAGGIGFFSIRSHYTTIGYQRAINEIAAQDRRAIDAADQARMRVRYCRDTGGVWDATEGICRGR
ncbi:hypothetical protein ACWX0K_11030 [Nitrobacteraceae bacterium UC4446_H13]